MESSAKEKKPNTKGQFLGYRDLNKAELFHLPGFKVFLTKVFSSL